MTDYGYASAYNGHGRGPASPPSRIENSSPFDGREFGISRGQNATPAPRPYPYPSTPRPHTNNSLTRYPTHPHSPRFDDNLIPISRADSPGFGTAYAQNNPGADYPTQYAGSEGGSTDSMAGLYNRSRSPHDSEGRRSRQSLAGAFTPPALHAGPDQSGAQAFQHNPPVEMPSDSSLRASRMWGLSESIPSRSLSGSRSSARSGEIYHAGAMIPYHAASSPAGQHALVRARSQLVPAPQHNQLQSPYGRGYGYGYNYGTVGHAYSSVDLRMPTVRVPQTGTIVTTAAGHGGKPTAVVVVTQKGDKVKVLGKKSDKVPVVWIQRAPEKKTKENKKNSSKHRRASEFGDFYESGRIVEVDPSISAEKKERTSKEKKKKGIFGKK